MSSFIVEVYRTLRLRTIIEADDPEEARDAALEELDTHGEIEDEGVRILDRDPLRAGETAE